MSRFLVNIFVANDYVLFPAPYLLLGARRGRENTFIRIELDGHVHKTLIKTGGRDVLACPVVFRAHFGLPWLIPRQPARHTKDNNRFRDGTWCELTSKALSLNSHHKATRKVFW